MYDKQFSGVSAVTTRFLSFSIKYHHMVAQSKTARFSEAVHFSAFPGRYDDIRLDDEASVNYHGVLLDHRPNTLEVLQIFEG